MTDHIIIQVDDKQRLLEFLQAEQTSAQQYADLCLRVLAEEWGADPAEIDKVFLLESCLGHLIHCEVEGEPIRTPVEFIVFHLKGCSDYGLGKCGLTRAKYDKRLSEVSE